MPVAVRLLCVALLTLASAAFSAAALAATMPDDPPSVELLPHRRLVAVSGLRLRARPDTDAPVLIRLPLGAPLAVFRRTATPIPDGEERHYWLLVTTPNEQTRGWVHSGFTRLQDPLDPLAARLDIISARAAQTDLELAAEVDLLMAITRALPDVTASAAAGVLDPALALMEARWEQVRARALTDPVVIDPGTWQPLFDAARERISPSTQDYLVRIEALIARLVSLAPPLPAPDQATAIATPGADGALLRAQISEALVSSSALKVAIAEFFITQGRLPLDAAEAGLPDLARWVGNWVSGIDYRDGAIHIRFGNRAAVALQGQVLSLRAALVDGAPGVPMAWTCGYAQPVAGMVAYGENRTSVPTNALPAQCR